MSTLKVGAIRGVSASSDAITVANDGTVSAKLSDIGGDQINGRNVWINGEFTIAQRGSEATGITSLSGYASGGPDRCFIGINNHGTWTVKQSTDAPSGYANSLEFLCTTGDNSIAADASVRWFQRFEGLNLQRFAKGTSDAKEFTVSWWIKSATTGTYAFELLDYDTSGTRSVVKTYTVDAENTWEHKTITFPADTVGPFDNDNNQSLAAEFWYVAGSNFTAGGAQTTWGATVTNKRAGGHTVNAGESNNDYIRVTGVQLEAGPIATEFEHENREITLLKCQRYYEKIASTEIGNNFYYYGPGYFESDTNLRGFIPYQRIKRAQPTITFSAANTWNAINTGSMPAGTSISSQYVSVQNTGYTLTTGSVSGRDGQGGLLVANNTDDAFIEVSAEI